MKDTIAQWLDRANTGLAVMQIDELRNAGVLPGGGKDFFPVVSYPPVTMYREMQEDTLFDRFNAHNNNLGLGACRVNNKFIGYLHIPFCPSRCTYCHWITKTKSKSDVVDTYIDYLIREMGLYRRRMGETLGLEKIPLSSVLWGGGTPTYPEPAQMEKLFEAYHQHYDLGACTQFSVEAEPRTLIGDKGMQRLRIMKDMGVDRISMGVQSFDDHVLRQMGRSHSHEESMKALENIRKAGFDNVYIDLIYGYPGQTPEKWVEELLFGCTLDVDGFQLYRLRVKQTGDRKGTIVNLLEKKPEIFHQADEVFLMKLLGKLICEDQGFGEYQRRIFSRRPGTSSHYLRDWFLKLYDVAGVGVSAWSTMRGVFAINVGDADLQNYFEPIERGRVPIDRGKILSFDDIARRSLMLPLKNDYLDKSFYRDFVGKDAHALFPEEFDWLKSMELIAEDDEKVWLTPRGGFFADEVATQFFNPDYVVFDDLNFAPGRKTVVQ